MQESKIIPARATTPKISTKKNHFLSNKDFYVVSSVFLKNHLIGPLNSKYSPEIVVTVLKDLSAQLCSCVQYLSLRASQSKFVF